MSEEARTKDQRLLDKAWKNFMASFCALRALVEQGGAKIEMNIKVKAATRKRK